jgi:hypothetical protein
MLKKSILYSDGTIMALVPLTSRLTQTDHEATLVASLSIAMAKAGFSISQVDLANFYVALKSKPLAILAGRANTGKTGLVQCLAQSLMGQDCLRIQMINGHPWWAEGCKDIANNTGLHERFVTEKMLSIIEEASQPENAQRVFISCLIQISPAELLSFFTDVAFQIQHGQLMRIGDAHLSEPIPFPSNLFIVGTMDTLNFDWWENDLLLSTTVIQWPHASVLLQPMPNRGSLMEEREFLQSCIRSRDSAYHKIIPILKEQRHPLFPLLQIEATLKQYASETIDRATDEVMIYLANSWSRLGNGLFHPSPARNLAIALDVAIAQILLPRAVDAIQGMETLRKQLGNAMKNRFPRSTAFVAAHSILG